MLLTTVLFSQVAEKLWNDWPYRVNELEEMKNQENQNQNDDPREMQPTNLGPHFDHVDGSQVSDQPLPGKPS